VVFSRAVGNASHCRSRVHELTAVTACGAQRWSELALLVVVAIAVVFCCRRRREVGRRRPLELGDINRENGTDTKGRPIKKKITSQLYEP
jgi:hypothetical protein